MPKLYFYDTGLAASLLGIESDKQLQSHYLTGSLFENLIIAELLKYRLHRGRPSNFYFWRDKTGHEIDCLIEKADFLIPVEIKSGKTVNTDVFGNLKYWHKLSKTPFDKTFAIYGGEDCQKTPSGNLLSWQEMSDLFRMI